jgi:ATP-dependent Clp protease ATP-binding subunit ClpA
MKEATELHHSYVGTEHLLLGLLGEAKGSAAQVLGSFGVTLETARTEVLRILGTDMPGERTPEPPRGEKPAEIRLILRYSNGAVVLKNFTDAVEAATFLSGL